MLTWLNDTAQKFDHLRDRFEKGMLNRATALVDEAGDVAEEALVMGPKGFLDPISMADKKNRTDTKLRVAALLAPAKFSPTSKVAQQVALTQINVTKNNITELTDEQLQRIQAEFERKKAENSAILHPITELLPPDQDHA